MQIVVPVKMVPDLVEELDVEASGTALDRSFLKLVLNEFDEHALETALLLKEAHGGSVTVVAPEAADVDDALFTCLAKGADRAIKITGVPEDGLDSHAAARAVSGVLDGLTFDLVLTGVQAADDRDGQLGPLVAAIRGLPHVSVVSRVEADAGGRSLVVQQEHAGGVVAEFDVDLPAVLGVQAAPQTPRYAPMSKVRQIMKTASLEESPLGSAAPDAGSSVARVFKPEAAGHADMIDGSPEEVADKLLAVLVKSGVAGR